MSILTPRMRAAFQFYQNYRARLKAARTLAEMDDATLKDVGMSRGIRWIAIDTGGL
jgi:uncharacterized protein YjiS (DUF1127 family)